MTAGPSALLADPDWLAHRYDPGHDAVHFRRVARTDRAAVPFLTDEYLGAEAAPLVIARDGPGGAASAVPHGGPPLHFLFHSAYCASTMLAHLLDQPGAVSSLSEPVLLNDMVGWRRRGADPRQQGKVMADMLALLARAYPAERAVVVKPSNIFNPLARGALTLRPDAKAVLLYAPLKPFLLSVARKGLWCRLWCRELLEGYLADGYGLPGFAPPDYFRQSDLQVAAAGWLAQQQDFARLLAWAPDRIAALDSETLTGQPVAAVAAVMQHYGLAADPGALAAHPALGRNSKSGESFAPGDRQRDLAAAEAAYGEEIGQVVGWAEAVAKQAAIPLTLPGALTIGR